MQIQNLQPFVIGLVLAMVEVVLGLLLTPLVVDFAIVAATATGIGSFVGVSSIVGIIPIIWVVLVLILAIVIVGVATKLAKD